MFQHCKATTTKTLKMSLNRTQTLTWKFWETSKDRQKRFSPLKIKIQGELVGWFLMQSINWKLPRNINEENKGPGNSNIENSHFSCNFKAHESESAVKANCYQYKQNTIGVNLECIMTTQTWPPPFHVSANLRCGVPKIERSSKYKAKFGLRRLEDQK